MMKPFLATGWLLIAVAVPRAAAAEPTPDDIAFFETKVRPLLVAHCQQCHSRATKQKGGLTLDSRAALLKGGDTGPAIVPGNPDKSRLVELIGYGGDIQMPPKGKLPDAAIADLTTWVKRGAPWPAGGEATAGNATAGNAATPFDLKERAKHWAFQPLRPGDVPSVKNAPWPRSAVDRYLLARLEAAGLAPAAAADRRTLLRRVTFDLTGLPPTPAEMAAFLADEAPDAYEKVVDRLLASPHYGERWARHWLDLVRYADTRGHEYDFDIPEAFEYRDYVIRAHNADVPFNQLVLEHVAGDLLSEPRRHPTERFNESIMGTGFWYLGEMPHSPVDVRADEADRTDNQIDVFGKTFLGLTVACARCHDHKFDAIATKDYYALAGYLHSSRFQRAFVDDPAPGRAIAGRVRATREEGRDLAIAVTARTLDKLLPDLVRGARAADPLLAPLVDLARAADQDFTARKEAQAARLKADADRAARAIVFDDFTHPTFGDWAATGLAFADGPARRGDLVFRGDDRLPVARVLRGGIVHSGIPSTKLQGALRSRTFRLDRDYIHFHVAGRGGKINLIVDGYQLIREPIYGGLTFDISHGERPAWHPMNVAMWKGHNAYIEVLDDGDGDVSLDRICLADDPAPPEAPNRLLAGLLDDAALDTPAKFSARLEALLREVVEQWRSGRLGALSHRDSPGALNATVSDSSDSTADDRLALLDALLASPAPSSPVDPADQERLAAWRQKLAAAEAQIPRPRRAPALADGTGQNEHVYIRGNPRSPGEEAPRRLLEVLGGADQPAAPASGSGRLELARRMVRSDNPLLARVLVNRLWLHHFGEGLVRSPDDFGVQGQPPTHPELLDYLATEFMRQGWSMKKMHRLLVLSSAYRMASQGDPQAEAADPQNKQLHRMPRRRLEAEAVRDAMLAVSGRLDVKPYGPGVMPYLTPFMIGRGRPEASGPLDSDGRRSIYLSVRRNFLPPLFVAFDYPTPFTTIGRRGASNVPAQALTLMNNPFVTQQASLWARHVLAEPGKTQAQRVAAMYETAFGRAPTAPETAEALAFLDAQTTGGGAEANATAWADLAHILFNVKEFVFVN